MNLTGYTCREFEVKSFDELNEIGTNTTNVQLLHFNFINSMCCHFWARDYIKVSQLLEKHRTMGEKRILEIVRVFFEGISSLSLARQTHQPKWRKKGEDALEKMLSWVQISTWNFENMALLLQAEVHYLNGELMLANDAYEASIISAKRNHFFHYEALAHELYGIFCLENRITDQGIKQLQSALAKYEKWGATKKVTELQNFIDMVNPSYLRRELKIRI